MKAKLEALKRTVEEHETRKMSADDLDAVAGGEGSSNGEGSCFVRDGVAYIVALGYGEMTVDEFYDIIKWAYDSYGEDIAIGLANQMFPTLHNETALRAGGPEYLRDTLRSKIFSVEENGISYGIWS
jgi:hypothetical protein